MIVNEELKEPTWIARPAALERVARELRKHSIVAVDTESNSLFAYQERVCLIQFSTSADDYLIDPLALSDLSCLAPIFADPKIEKVFHAAEYDVICLKRDFGFSFRNLFDTMVASRILGKEGVGLGNILKEEFGIVLDKRYQRANWGQRPLPPAQLAYARLDTHYLVELRNRLKAELEEKGRWKLALEDFRRLENTEVPEIELNQDGMCWKVAGNNDLTARQMAILHSLCIYRDQAAKTANLPHFKVISNEALVEIALKAPQTDEELSTVTKLSHRQVERYGEGLVQAVKKGMEMEAPRRPYSPRPDEQFLARLDALRNWRKNKGRNMGVESDVILPKDTMEVIAQANPKSIDDLYRAMKQIPWRFSEYGEEILRTIRS